MAKVKKIDSGALFYDVMEGRIDAYELTDKEAAAVLKEMGVERDGVFYVGPYLGGNVMGWPTFPRMTMWESLQEVVAWALPLVQEAERLESEFEA